MRNLDLKSKRQKIYNADLVKPIISKEENPLNRPISSLILLKDGTRGMKIMGCMLTWSKEWAYEQKKEMQRILNFALIGALQAAGLNADPLLFSTRNLVFRINSPSTKWLQLRNCPIKKLVIRNIFWMLLDELPSFRCASNSMLE